MLKPFHLVIPLASCSNFALQLRTGYGVLKKYFQKRGIKEQSHNCECGQMETVEHVLKKYPLHPAERDLLRKVSPELDSKILLDNFHGKFGAIERLNLLRTLTPLLCQSHRDKCFLKFHVFFVYRFVL